MISPGEGGRREPDDFGSRTGTAELDRPKTEEAKERATQAAAETKDALSRASQDLKHQAKAAGEELRGAAQRLTGEAKGRLSEQVAARKDQVVGHVSGIGAAVRDAADRLEQDHSPVAGYVRAAADGLDRAADHLRSADLRDLYGDAERFARRHPEVVLGGLFLAGVGIARFLKASSDERRREDLRTRGFADAPSYGRSKHAGTGLHPTGDFQAMRPIGHYGTPGTSGPHSVREALDTGHPMAAPTPEEAFDSSAADDQFLRTDASGYGNTSEFRSAPAETQAPFSGTAPTELDIPFDQRSPR